MINKYNKNEIKFSQFLLHTPITYKFTRTFARFSDRTKFLRIVFRLIPGRPCKRCTKYRAKHANKIIFREVCRTIGSATMSRESRATARASTNGTPWTVSSPGGRHRPTVYATSEYFFPPILPQGERFTASIYLPIQLSMLRNRACYEICFGKPFVIFA